MLLAAAEPKEKQKEKIRELYRTYPYHLLKEEPITLRMKNFYFDKSVRQGDMIKVYRADNPEHPDTDTDELYVEKPYGEKKGVNFVYQNAETEYLYAVNERHGEVSNVLTFYWE